MTCNNFKYELSLLLLIFAFIIVLPLIIDFFVGKFLGYTGAVKRCKYSLENTLGISVLSLYMFNLHWNGTFNLFLKTILILSIIITLVYIIEGLMCKKRNKKVK